MSRPFPWSRLGIDPTSDAGAIRKAYADILRATNVDEDIAGYAELRRARDSALWLAAQGVREDAEETDEDEGELYGLGALDDDPGDDWLDDGGAWDIAPGIQRPGEADPDFGPAPQPGLTEDQRRARAAWNTLLDVLYPDGANSDEAVTHAELEEGLAALDVLLARAEVADLAENDALDDGLAEVFARTWPRSAPFVEPANAAFGWLGEAGALEERPALMFLNQRLKGMRFHENVQKPEHPLHKAWTELSRPGRAGFFDRLKVKRLEVDKLLTGIRQRYPELESHLDPERVASWDKGGALDGTPGGTGPSVVRWLFVMMLIAVALSRLGSAVFNSNNDDSVDPKTRAAEALSEAYADIEAGEIFGKGTGMAAVRAADPVFADQLRAAMGDGEGPKEALAFVRFRAAASAEVAEYDELVVRADLRGIWMRAALAQSPDVCRNIMAADFASVPLKLDEKQRGREQALLKQLLEAKVLNHKPEGRQIRYSIPGWLVDQTIKGSGLPEERLVAALTKPDHPDRCKAETALIEATLKAPGRVSKELLQSL